jgi:hypothetical protein
MDILMSNAYLCDMLARVITMLAIFAITVVTTVASAHARMSVLPDHAMHVSEMMHASGNSDLSSDRDQPCGSADSGLCEFVCTGLSVFLTSSGEVAGHDHGPARHDLPSGAIHTSQTSALDERPPILRLL